MTKTNLAETSSPAGALVLTTRVAAVAGILFGLATVATSIAGLMALFPTTAAQYGSSFWVALSGFSAGPAHVAGDMVNNYVIGWALVGVAWGIASAVTLWRSLSHRSTRMSVIVTGVIGIVLAVGSVVGNLLSTSFDIGMILMVSFAPLWLFTDGGVMNAGNAIASQLRALLIVVWAVLAYLWSRLPPE